MLIVALVVLALKVWMAARTWGTNDIGHWTNFANAEREYGPERIYERYYDYTTQGNFYNHPPLMGYYLAFVNWMSDLGVGLPLTIRTTSSLADVGTALVFFELIRVRRGTRAAAIAGLLIGASPVLFLVSGFHGNTDPIFTFLVFLAVWLLVDRNRPAWAGVALAISVGVKIVPFVIIPALLIYAFRKGLKPFFAFGIAFGVVFVLTWAQGLLTEFGRIKNQVFGYPGSGSYWGVVQVGRWLNGGPNPGWVDWFVNGGRFIPVAICALVAAAATWRRPALLPQAVAWAVIAFLALGSAYAIQYTVWPLAACYLFGNVWATAYNLTIGLWDFKVYDRWSGGLPWYQAKANDPTKFEVDVLIAPWLVLMVVLVRGLWALFGAPGGDRIDGPAPSRAGDSTTAKANAKPDSKTIGGTAGRPGSLSSAGRRSRAAPLTRGSA